MAKSKVRSLRKPSGARYGKMYRKKKLIDLMGIPTFTHVAETVRTKIKRVRGGNKVHALVNVSHANVTDGKKTFKVKIKSVLENPASRHFVRQNVVTKGAIIDTAKGKARVTSRPSKQNIVNAVLVK